jgi:hypothetical protein
MENNFRREFSRPVKKSVEKHEKNGVFGQDNAGNTYYSKTMFLVLDQVYY